MIFFNETVLSNHWVLRSKKVHAWLINKQFWKRYRHSRPTKPRGLYILSPKRKNIFLTLAVKSVKLYKMVVGSSLKLIFLKYFKTKTPTRVNVRLSKLMRNFVKRLPARYMHLVVHYWFPTVTNFVDYFSIYAPFRSFIFLPHTPFTGKKLKIFRSIKKKLKKRIYS